MYLAKAKGVSYTTFKPVTKLLMSHLPNFYNPIPEIFAERVAGIDGIFDDAPERNVYAFPSPEHANKLMVREGLGEAYLQRMIHECGVGQKSAAVEGWVYVNGPSAAICGLNVQTATAGHDVGH